MWYNEFGKDGDVVLSSRVRLARNLDGVPFPLAANEKQQEEVLDKCRGALLDKGDNTLEELDLKLDDEEISNIAVHVGGAIERAEHNQKKKVFKVIIVCVSGIGTSMLVKNKLEYLFEDKIKIVKMK